MRRGSDLAFSFSFALRELEAVHRRDQARLLREACALACVRTRHGRLYVAGVESVPSGSSPEVARSRWNRACAEEIDTARADEFPVDAWLPRLLELPTCSWPRATSLARASLELHPTDRARIDLARARIAEADSSGAIGELREILDEDLAPPERGTALEALGLALECEGESRASLACYRAAVLESRSDPRVAVALLALALRLEDGSGVSLAARRLASLDLTVAGTRRRFDRALRAVRGRARRAERGGIRPQWGILEMALSGSGACSEVAHALM